MAATSAGSPFQACCQYHVATLRLMVAIRVVSMCPKVCGAQSCPDCLTFSMWLCSARRAGGNSELLHGVLHRRWFRTVAVGALETPRTILADFGTDKFIPALPKEIIVFDFRPSPTFDLSLLFRCIHLSAAVYDLLPWHVADKHPPPLCQNARPSLSGGDCRISGLMMPLCLLRWGGTLACLDQSWRRPWQRAWRHRELMLRVSGLPQHPPCS